MTEEPFEHVDDQHGQPHSPKSAPHLESAWLGVTLHSIGHAVVATDTKGVVTFMNPAAESLTGWGVEEAHGRPLETVLTILSGDSRLPVENPVALAVREGKAVRPGNQTILIARDGTERLTRLNAAPIRDDQGQIAGVVLTLQDTTEQHRAEQNRQAALDYANDIIDTLRHPFLVLDSDLRVASANRSFFRTFRVSPEETEGQRVYDLGNGQWDIPRLRKLLEEILPQKTSFEDFEVVHEFPAIGRRHMLLNARRIQRKDEQAVLILLGIEDVTERRQLEEERRELETRFTSLVKNVKDHAIFTLDKEGHILSWNVEAGRILGYTEEEALGQHFSLIFTADDIEGGMPEEELRLAGETGRAEDERWHRRKDGGLLWALGIVTPLHDARGNHTGFSKILRDITDRKNLEEALRDADRRKDEFLATLAHELRNPLAPIRTGLEVMRMMKDDPVIVERTRSTIERQAEQMVRLVDDLLDVSRITRGKLELRKSRTELADVVRSAVEASQPFIDEAGHELAVTLPGRPIVMHADPHRLAQVISNLLNNAAKYTPGGGRIRLTAERQGDEAVITAPTTASASPPTCGSGSSSCSPRSTARGEEARPDSGSG